MNGFFSRESGVQSVIAQAFIYEYIVESRSADIEDTDVGQPSFKYIDMPPL